MRLAALAALVALVPLAAALPAVCPDPCVVASSGAGYEPLVSVIASGASVVWTSSDYTHITQDGRGLGDDPCFFVLHDPDSPSPAVRFDVVGTALVATVEGQSAVCGSAVATPAGATLPYYCWLHPTMRGALVVTG
ncbi:MAG TPA: hypothetical protein VM582_06415 [Candidatus Thermoplasmatota archaeon]|nr:hypothetical protein [Candidatus Thermoplasmatota archaeon]